MDTALYFLFPGVIVIADLLRRRSKPLLYSVVFVVGLFLCFGYMTGSDWRAYELAYGLLLIKESPPHSTDPGFLLLMLPFTLSGVEFWHFFIVAKVVLYLIFCYYIRRFAAHDFYYAFAIFYGYIAVFLFIDNPMRNLIASAVYLFALKHIREREWLKYLFVCFVAVLFHKSALLLIPLYFVLNRTYQARHIAIAFIAFNALIHIYGGDLVQAVKSIDYAGYADSKETAEKLYSYVLADDIEDKRFSLGLLARYIAFIVLILSKKRIERSSGYGAMIFNGSILVIVILRLAFLWPILVRVVIPLSLFFCVAIAIAVRSSDGIMKPVYYATFLVFYSAALYSQITSAYKYIPYTSYLSYCFADKPDYEYRSDYNLSHSPYRDKSPR